jgi:hypothetical protein
MIIFINIPWMNEYKGAFKDKDVPIGQMSFTKWKPLSDHCQFNFQPYLGDYYGYIPGSFNPNKKRFGNTRNEVAENITVVWVAKDPCWAGIPSYRSHSHRIVGWYKNAQVYFERQEVKGNLERQRAVPDRDEGSCGYSIKAQKVNVVLLPPNARPLLPETTQNGDDQGQLRCQCPIYYGTKHRNEETLSLINKYKPQSAVKKKRRSVGKVGWKNSDASERRKIEDNAMKVVWRHFENQYDLVDESKNNLGYDILATSREDESIHFFLEVKGTKSDEINVELTPNEYDFAKKQKKEFLLCIVREALTKKPSLNCFHPVQIRGKHMTWEDVSSGSLKLQTQERTAARITEKKL